MTDAFFYQKQYQFLLLYTNQIFFQSNHYYLLKLPKQADSQKQQQTQKSFNHLILSLCLISTLFSYFMF